MIDHIKPLFIILGTHDFFVCISIPLLCLQITLIFSFYEYRDFLIEVIEHLSPEIVIHRLTGDGLSEQLIAPYWSKYKRDFFNSIHNTMFSLDSFQGKSYEVPNESRSTNTL